MDMQAIESELAQNIANCAIELSAEGNKLAIRLVSDEFEGLSRVKRQQAVYAVLDSRIKSGEIHAVSMVTLTVSEANK